jgi:hypothetical protein
MLRYFFCTLLLVSGCPADTLYLRNGGIVNGDFLGATPRQIRIDIGGQTQVFDIGDVASITFGQAAPAAAPVAAPAPVPAQAYANPAPVSGFQLAAGTSFVVRMIDSVDSERNRVGQTFRASMDQPVYVNGQQVIPRGTEVVVNLVDSKESGKIAGRSSLTLNLVSVRINGRMVDINTQSVTQTSGSRGARTAKMGVGGAGLGAAIGAIAGGGKGAAIGAGAGAGAGVGAEVLTKGQRVRIPSETRVTFILDVPVSI